MQQSIKEDAHEVLEVDGELVSVRRLVAGGSGFQLKGGCWAKDNYS